MCCTDPTVVDLPTEVEEMLLRYRHTREVDPDGLDPSTFITEAGRLILRHCPFLSPERKSELGRLHLERGDIQTWFDSPELAGWVRDTVDEDGKPPELSIVRLRRDGAIEVLSADPMWLLPDSTVSRYVLIHSQLFEPSAITVADRDIQLPGHGAELLRLDVTTDRCSVPIEARAGQSATLTLARPSKAARLRLASDEYVRWSVVDDLGGAWFPEDAPRKWDFHGRPFFHGQDVVLDVPVTPIVIRASRGLEYRTAEVTVTPSAEAERTVQLTPRRWIDPARKGWYGADLHVHMNYSDRLVIEPKDAAMMQHGEGLHFMNLLAANLSGSLIYDREALESWPGVDLPWSRGDIRARMGVEYRNDLLGHVHATGLSAAPSRYHTGHAGSDADEDWPPNDEALRELRDLGAVTGYCHPVRHPIDDDSPPDAVFEEVRTVECRELVADAALGLVDSMDVLSNFSGQGAAVLFRRLLGAGISMAATVGTDSMLSVPYSAPYSNPPGWARMYAHLGEALDVDGLKQAIREGRTFVTNGPWLQLTVDGAEPGARLQRARGQRVRARAEVRGPAVRRLRIHTADGVLAEAEVGAEEAALEVDLVVDEANFVVAAADGDAHPDILDSAAMAHTSAVFVDIEGGRVARPKDARWCLDWLDRLEKLATKHGVFHEASHRDDLLEVIERARGYYESVAEAGSR